MHENMAHRGLRADLSNRAGSGDAGRADEPEWTEPSMSMVISPCKPLASGVKRSGALDGTGSRPVKRARVQQHHGSPARTPFKLCDALCGAPLQMYLVGGQTNREMRQRIRASGILHRGEGWTLQPNHWREHRLSVVEAQSQQNGMQRTRFDKAFCVEWISNDTLAVSTKSGHILRVDRATRTFNEVDLEGVRWVEPPIVTEDDLHRQRVDRGGIHCVRANESQNLLACSGGRREDHNVYVLNLNSPKWATVRRGDGHRDWVFTLNWVSDTSFVTGSRDSTVMVWQPSASTGYTMAPVARYGGEEFHTTKVRSSSYSRETDRLMTLDVAGCLILWDAMPSARDLRVQRRFQLQHPYRSECTCGNLDGNMLVIGARDFMTIYDARRKSCIANVPLAKLNYKDQLPEYHACSARSVSSKGSLLSLGMSTGGTIVFFDKRKLSSCVDIQVVTDWDGGKHSKASMKRAVSAIESATGTMLPPPPPQPQDRNAAETMLSGFLGPGTDHGPGPVPRARYGLRDRHKLAPPDRFTSYYAAKDAAEVAASRATDVLDLTGRLKASAVLRQPHGEIHHDEVAYYGLANDNAIFSHAWSPDGCSMFACGGPLAMGVRGCHLAMWT